MRRLLIALSLLLATPAIAATQPQTTNYTSTQTGTAVCTPTISACVPPQTGCSETTYNCTLNEKTAGILLGPLSSGSSQSGGGGIAPVVASHSCTIALPVINGTNTSLIPASGGACAYSATCSGSACSGSNAITSWAITAQSTANSFSITSSGVLQGGSAAGAVTAAIYTVTVTATNSTGTSSGVTQTVTVANTIPTVTSQACTVDTPLSTGVNTTPGCTYAATCDAQTCVSPYTITSWAITSQSIAGAFAITNAGVLQGGANASTVTAGTATITLTAANAVGTSSPVVETVTVVGNPVIQDPGPSQALFNNPYYSCNQNWYVGNFGSGSPSDSNNGTSMSTPWATLAHANSAITTTGTGSWCVTTATGFSASAGTSVTKGGTVASSAGYVVYKPQTLNGSTITDPGNQGTAQGLHAAFAVQANYVIIDGFTLSASSAIQFGVGIEVFNGTNNYAAAQHHVWALNNIITGYGLSGIGWSQGEYFGVVHNLVHGNSANSSCNGGPQGSGIAINEPFPTSGYTPTADDHSNSMIGNTGTLVKNWVMWNVAYNNHVAGCGSGGSTDGNGITMDTWNWGCYTGGSSSANCNTSGAAPYLGGVLEAFNIVYNNGGGGIHNNQAPYAIVANNSCYNNYTDTGFPSVGNLPCIDDNGSWANVFINNVSYVPGNANPTHQIAIGPFGPGGSSQNNFNTTLANSGGINSSATSIQLAATTNMPNGTSGMPVSGSYTLPGGNMIYVGTLPTQGGVGTGELMLVTAGWGTTTLTVVRGYQGTTATSHANGATITWVPDYFSNNITYATGANGSLDGSTQTFSGDIYPPSQNLTNTNVNYTNVGNTSTGSDSTQPNGTNFALSGGSPAISYGQTSTNGQTFLSTQSTDAGACYHSLTTCP
jgi:trimeric autotransporter adhesin